MTSKESLRAVVRRARALRSADDLATAEREFADRVLERPEVVRADVVALYLSAGDEPPTLRLAETLRERGTTVLAPVMAPGRRLDWAAYAGRDRLRPAAFGIAEPTGDRLGAEALESASVIVLPALAVSHDGHRLGRGAGYYDRALGNADPAATRIALVFDDELLTDVPTESHDESVHLAVTPTRTWVCSDR